MTTILDYGMGNLRSVANALDLLGEPWEIKPDLDQSPSRLIIPGVGAFGAAMERIKLLKDQIRDLADRQIPILGICLGQQLLMTSSEEFGSHEGLDLIPGTVRYLPKIAGNKIPHVGWNTLRPCREDPILSEVQEGDQAYFVHSLYTDPEDESTVIAAAEYGIEFPAMLRKGSLWACQFHPEKSGEVGLGILRQFCLCK